MNDYQENVAFEQLDPVEPSKGEGIKAMVFGILSIYLGWFSGLGIVGIIFGLLAKKWSVPILTDFPNSAAAKFAKIGKLTGTIGFWASIATTIMVGLIILAYVAYIVFVGVLLSSIGAY